METDSQIKEILYQELTNISEEKLQTCILKEKSSEIISEIISKCYPKIHQIEGDLNKNIVLFAESLMHNLLTVSLIPSQRKIVHNDLEIDMIIPDLKTLKNNPEDSLIICFFKSKNKNTFEQYLAKLKKIQPNKENIWIVTNSETKTLHRTYSVKKVNSFTKILDDINKFLSLKKPNKLKILKS